MAHARVRFLPDSAFSAAIPPTPRCRGRRSELDLMKTRLTAGLALTGAVILASCAQDQPSSRLLPTQASLSVVPAACSFPATYAAANAYFAQTSDPVYRLVITM